MIEEENEKAGNFALTCSFIVPIVGIICYFVNRKKVECPSLYLWAALTGWVVVVMYHHIIWAVLSTVGSVAWTVLQWL